MLSHALGEEAIEDWRTISAIQRTEERRGKKKGEEAGGGHLLILEPWWVFGLKKKEEETLQSHNINILLSSPLLLSCRSGARGRAEEVLFQSGSSIEQGFSNVLGPVDPFCVSKFIRGTLIIRTQLE